MNAAAVQCARWLFPIGAGAPSAPYGGTAGGVRALRAARLHCECRYPAFPQPWLAPIKPSSMHTCSSLQRLFAVGMAALMRGAGIARAHSNFARPHVFEHARVAMTRGASSDGVLPQLIGGWAAAGRSAGAGDAAAAGWAWGGAGGGAPRRRRCSGGRPPLRIVAASASGGARVHALGPRRHLQGAPNLVGYKHAWSCTLPGCTPATSLPPAALCCHRPLSFPPGPPLFC